MRYDTKQRVFIVEKHIQLKSSTLVQRAWRAEFKTKQTPHLSTIERIVQRFKSRGTVADKPPAHTKPSAKRVESKNRLEDLFREFDNLSIRKAKAITGISYGTIQSILKEDLHLKPYKEHEWHELEPGDDQKRLDFAQFFRTLPRNAHLLLLACDEAYFNLIPPINKQNNRRWLASKPTDKIERPLHGEKVLVWCAISRDCIYGPYFFDETVNQHNYLDMLKNFFWKGHVTARDFKKYYFLQDNATPHTATMVQDYLKSKFGHRFIDKSKWPPRSPDLNPCDFFLWGYLKDRVYNPMPQTLAELKENIQKEFKKIPREMLTDVFENFLKRLALLKEVGGSHIEKK